MRGQRHPKRIPFNKFNKFMFKRHHQLNKGQLSLKDISAHNNHTDVTVSVPIGTGHVKSLL